MTKRFGYRHAIYLFESYKRHNSNRGVRRVTCHHVIVTTPLGVLQRHHGTMFTPGLGQEKVRSIMRMGAGKVSKIILEWDNPWWIQDHANLNLGNICNYST